VRRIPLSSRLAIVAILGGAVVLAGSPTSAQVTPEEGLAELRQSRALVNRSVELYEAGRAEDAYLAARNAYLDHFEFVEGCAAAYAYLYTYRQSASTAMGQQTTRRPAYRRSSPGLPVPTTFLG
jgi:hypothetical protein